MGEGALHNTSLETRTAIREGRVIPGMSEDEVMMAAGEPDDEKKGENGRYTWIFKRSNNKLLYVEFDGSGVVTKTYTKDAPKSSSTSTARKGGGKRTASKGSWKNGKGTPL